MLKILVLSDFDSRIKWGVTAALKITIADQVTLVMHRSQKDKVLYYTNQLQNIFYSDPLEYLKKFPISDYDVIIFAIGGWLNIKAVSLLQKLTPVGKTRPLLIGGLNGMVDRSDPDVVFSRSGLDLLFLNCRNDYKFFEETFNSLGVDSPVLLETGYLRTYQNEKSISSQSGNILFVQQDGVPASKKAYVYLVNKLVDFAATNSSSRIYIKLRNSGSIGVNSSFMKYDAAKITSNILSKNRVTQNIEVSNADLETLFSKCEEVWSISSTALIEALMEGKKAFCITDFGISKKNGNAPFLVSGILVSLDDLSDRKANVNKEWKIGNLSPVICDDALHEFVIDCIKKLMQRDYIFNKPFYKDSPWLNGINEKCDFRIKSLINKYF